MNEEVPKIYYNVKHLTKGDRLPPFNDKPRLYSMRYCPFAHRTTLALIAKQIDFEVIMIALDNKPQEYLDKSYFGKVPVLEIQDGVSLLESLAIVEYLDEVYPERQLQSTDPLRRAEDKTIAVYNMSCIHALVYQLKTNPKALNKDTISSFFKAVDNIQNHLIKRGSPYLHGEQPGFVDYMIWPWFERLPTFDDPRIVLYEHDYFKLLNYLDRMAKDPVVREYAVPIEKYKAFHNAQIAGQALPYDQLCDE